MNYLGKAKLVESRHASGQRVKSWDLSQWGGPLVFMGPVGQALPGGTTDRGTLRLETATGRVFNLEAGDPPPSTGTVGYTQRPLNLLTLVGVVGASLLLGKMRRRR